jgi:hypothetical protein
MSEMSPFPRYVPYSSSSRHISLIRNILQQKIMSLIVLTFRIIKHYIYHLSFISLLPRPKTHSTQRRKSDGRSRNEGNSGQRNRLTPIQANKTRPATSSDSRRGSERDSSTQMDNGTESCGGDSDVNASSQRPRTTQTRSGNRKRIIECPPVVVQLPTTNLITRTIPSPNCRVGTSSTFRSRHGEELGKFHKGLLRNFHDNKKRANSQALRFQSKLHAELRKVRIYISMWVWVYLCVHICMCVYICI